MIFVPGDKVVFIGDSITDAGRVRPVGEGKGEALGKGYVALIDALISAVYPELKLRIVNMGISGNTVRDLDARWDTDVYDLDPDWLSIMIGINDVWRQHDRALISENHVLKDEYTETLDKLVSHTRPRLKGMILMSPYFIEPLKNDSMRRMMDEYSLVVKAAADKYKCVFVDTQAAFDEYLRYHHSSALGWDRVHPDMTGHMLMAKGFLRAVGFVWQ